MVGSGVVWFVDSDAVVFWRSIAWVGYLCLLLSSFGVVLVGVCLPIVPACAQSRPLFLFVVCLCLADIWLDGPQGST